MLLKLKGLIGETHHVLIPSKDVVEPINVPHHSRGSMAIDDLKKRVQREFKKSLNRMLDEVNEFEKSGGFKRLFNGEFTPQNPIRGGDKSIRTYYANLEVPMGSNMEVVKASYRRLMQKYHPDRHADNPEMEARATELAQELTRAYNAIEAYLAER